MAQQFSARHRGHRKGIGLPVGIFDSGLGGLTIYSAVSKQLPDISFCYLGDNGNAPYGVRSGDEIFQLTCNAVEQLWAVGCDLVVLACNTASAAALKRIQETWLPNDKRVLGVFVPTIEKLTERSWGDNSPPRRAKVERIALFATPATVASRAFQRELAFRAIGVDVESQPCGGLVDAIEDGDLMLAEAIARGHVEALLRRMPTPQAAVLGCTHYPLIGDFFAQALEGVAIIDQPALVAESLADYLDRHPDMKGSNAAELFLTSGDPVSISARATRLLRRKVEFARAPKMVQRGCQ